MTRERRFEQDLPDLMAQLAQGSTPDYRDHIVRQTARMRQRPAWTFPERWFPMNAVTTRLATAPRVPWRLVALVALLVITLIIGAILVVGSRPRLPSPFGRAVNGHVAYAANGDIFTVDPVSHVATAIVTGPETDLRPVWSRDGSRLVFERKVGGTSGPGRLYVTRPDGHELIAVTPEPREGLANYAFSPDGREIMFTAGPEKGARLWIAKVDGSAMRQLDVGMSVVHPSYRPPNGAEIIYAGEQPIDGGNGLYAVDVASGAIRTILAPAPGVGRDAIRVAPDGSRIAFSARTAEFPAPNTFRVHIVAADGTGETTLLLPARATFQDAPVWSNDGTRLAVVRGYDTFDQDMALAVVPADGGGLGVETERGLTGCCGTINEWAPDDTVILTTPEKNGARQQLLWDPSTGVSTAAPWTTISEPAWQRRAP